MARCYSVCVPNRQMPRSACPLPDVWLVSDAVNDAALEAALRRLPRGSGLIFRHYHLAPAARRARFKALRCVAHRFGHCVILSGNAAQASHWGADGVYGPAERLAQGPALPRLVTAHSLHEIGRANGLRAAAILLSPVFPTHSHPGAPSLGPVRFRLLARRSRVPVIALGGINTRRARQLGTAKWAAIRALA